MNSNDVAVTRAFNSLKARLEGPQIIILSLRQVCGLRTDF